MPSTESYLEFVMDQLSGLDGVTYRAMMGEYLIYCKGSLVAGIYDDRFLVKPTASTIRMMPSAARELPYPGGKEMLLVADELDDRAFLAALLSAAAEDLPLPKGKRKSGK